MVLLLRNPETDDGWVDRRADRQTQADRGWAGENVQLRQAEAD